jgi:uncharacterized protein (DUF1697 family)
VAHILENGCSRNREKQPISKKLIVRSSAMMTYISLLRGINVGGKKPIKIGALGDLYQALGLRRVRTYLQSGNIIFDSTDVDTNGLSIKIQNELKKTIGFPVSVLLKKPEELREIIRNNPFVKEKEQIGLYVTFLFSSPSEACVEGLDKGSSNADEFAVRGKTIYVYCANGYGRTKYSNDYFEKKLGVVATTRNWKMVNKLLQLTDYPAD